MAETSPFAAVLEAIRDGRAGGKTMPERICFACVASMPVDGAAISLKGKDAHPERVGSSDDITRRIEELQVTVGEGPGVDSFASGGPLLVPDLEAVVARRWPALADVLTGDAARAVFVFPLQLGAIRLGALTLYRLTPGALPDASIADALRVADLIAMLLLGNDGDLVEDFSDEWLAESSWTPSVHQATGMIISQLGVGAEEAFVRLRAFAFARDLPLSAVAGSVVRGELRLAEEDA